MAIIIIQCKKPKGAIEAGIDIHVEPIGEPKNKKIVMNNLEPGKYFPGGPV